MAEWCGFDRVFGVDGWGGFGVGLGLVVGSALERVSGGGFGVVLGGGDGREGESALVWWDMSMMAE